MCVITKRDGRKVNFDGKKIENAILAAFKETDGRITDYAQEKANTISTYIEGVSKEKELSIEEIQDLVENGLMTSKRKDVARNYMIYRYNRNRDRERNSKIRKAIKEKLAASNVQNQNANVDEHSFGGRMGEASEVMSKDIALEEIMSFIARYNHINNIIYTHDLGHYALGDHNCLSIPFDDILAKGFNTRQTDVRPAKSVSTAMQLIAVISQLQSLQQFGGVSATHLDWTMVPYVRLSLFKHYIMEYLKTRDDFMELDIIHLSGDEIDYYIDEHKDEYLEELKLTKEDFYIGTDKLDKALYQRALFETVKEIYQSVEALYHNLNTLQSRSGELIALNFLNCWNFLKGKSAA